MDKQKFDVASLREFLRSFMTLKGHQQRIADEIELLITRMEPHDRRSNPRVGGKPWLEKTSASDKLHVVRELLKVRKPYKAAQSVPRVVAQQVRAFASMINDMMGDRVTPPEAELYALRILQQVGASPMSHSTRNQLTLPILSVRFHPYYSRRDYIFEAIDQVLSLIDAQRVQWVLDVSEFLPPPDQEEVPLQLPQVEEEKPQVVEIGSPTQQAKMFWWTRYPKLYHAISQEVKYKIRGKEDGKLTVQETQEIIGRWAPVRFVAHEMIMVMQDTRPRRLQSHDIKWRASEDINFQRGLVHGTLEQTLTRIRHPDASQMQVAIKSDELVEQIRKKNPRVDQELLARVILMIEGLMPDYIEEIFTLIRKGAQSATTNLILHRFMSSYIDMNVPYGKVIKTSQFLQAMGEYYLDERHVLRQSPELFWKMLYGFRDSQDGETQNVISTLARAYQGLGIPQPERTISAVPSWLIADALPIHYALQQPPNWAYKRMLTEIVNMYYYWVGKRQIPAQRNRFGQVTNWTEQQNAPDRIQYFLEWIKEVFKLRTAITPQQLLKLVEDFKHLRGDFNVMTVGTSKSLNSGGARKTRFSLMMISPQVVSDMITINLDQFEEQTNSIDIPTALFASLFYQLRQLNWKAWKVSRLRQLLQLSALIKLSVRSSCKVMREGVTQVTYTAASQSHQLRILEPVMQNEASLRQCGELSWRMCDEILKRAKQLQDNYVGDATEIKLSSPSLYSDLPKYVQWWKPREQPEHGRQADIRSNAQSFYHYMAWASAQPKKIGVTGGWDVFSNEDPQLTDPDYLKWLQSQDALRYQYDYRPCLSRCVAYLTKLNSAMYDQDSALSGFINRGMLSEIVDWLVLHGYQQLGILRDNCPVMNTFIVGARHFYVTPLHVTIVSAKKSRDLVFHRRGAGAILGVRPKNKKKKKDDGQSPKKPEIRPFRLECQDQPFITLQTRKEMQKMFGGSWVDPDQQQQEHSSQCIQVSGEENSDPQDISVDPETEMLDQQKVLSRKDELIAKTFEVMKQNTLYWDIQCFSTVGSAQYCYLSTMIGWVDGKEINNVIQAASPLSDVMTEFSEFLYSFHELLRSQDNKKVVIWTFNGLKYELKYLLQPICKRFGSVSSMGSRNMCKGLKLGTCIQIADARLLYTSGTLKQNTQKYCKNYKKMDFDIGSVITWEHWLSKREAIMEYNKYDCLSLSELVMRFYAALYAISQDVLSMRSRHEKRNVQPFRRRNPQAVGLQTILKKRTCPSIALLLFQNIYVGKAIISNNENATAYAIHRHYYFGGMVDVLRHINYYQEKVYYLDVTSMYPYIMSLLRIPVYYKRLLYANQFDQSSMKQSIREDNCGSCFFNVRNVKYGQCHQFLPTRSSKGLIFLDQISQTYCWGASLKTILDFGGDFQIVTCTEYTDLDKSGTQVKSFNNYVSDFFDLKSKATDDLWRDIYKLFLNSLYGKFGQRPLEKHYYTDTDMPGISTVADEMSINPPKAESKRKSPKKPSPSKSQENQQKKGPQLMKNLIKRMDLANGVSHIVMTQKRGASGVGLFVRIASFITDGARALLARAVSIAGRGNVFYMDTDSVFVNKSGLQRLRHHDMLHPQKLGKFKVQQMKVNDKKVDCVFDKTLFVSRKNYMLFNEQHKKYFFKAKGINWKGSDQEKAVLFTRLEGSMHKLLAHHYAPLGYYPFQTIDLGVRLDCQRWLLGKDGKSNVIERYPKRVSVNLKRYPDMVKNRAYTLQEAKSFMDESSIRVMI